MTKKFHLHKARLETLVDGVFAIAMTILVLEVKVPSISDKYSALDLLHALAHDGVVIFAYFVSFLALGVFWVWHHKLTEKVAEIDLPMLICSLAFLSLICFFPFVAALFGRYPQNLTANIVYVLLLGLILASQTLFFWMAMTRKKIADFVTPNEALNTHRVNLLSLAIYCISLSATGLRISIYAALTCLLAGVFLLWRFKRSKNQPALQSKN
nr:TMEM175 family protein [uncultured Undibacterium sp.]